MLKIEYLIKNDDLINLYIRRILSHTIETTNKMECWAIFRHWPWKNLQYILTHCMETIQSLLPEMSLHDSPDIVS